MESCFNVVRLFSPQIQRYNAFNDNRLPFLYPIGFFFLPSSCFLYRSRISLVIVLLPFICFLNNYCFLVLLYGELQPGIPAFRQGTSLPKINNHFAVQNRKKINKKTMNIRLLGMVSPSKILYIYFCSNFYLETKGTIKTWAKINKINELTNYGKRMWTMVCHWNVRKQSKPLPTVPLKTYCLTLIRLYMMDTNW